MVAPLFVGCTGLRSVDSAVQSYSTLGASSEAVRPKSYRFERLPLASADPAAQAALEAWTAQALAGVGLVPVNTGAANSQLTVQVGANVVRYDTLPWADPWPGWRFGLGFGAGRVPWSWGGASAIGAGYDNYLPPSPRYQRELEIVLRSVATGSVVYQSKAVNDSGWWDSDAVLRAMVGAALQGFPTPPPGTRYVRTPLPGGD